MMDQLVSSKTNLKQILIAALFILLILLSAAAFFVYPKLLIVSLPALGVCILYFFFDRSQGSKGWFGHRDASSHTPAITNYFDKVKVPSEDASENSMEMLDDTQASVFFNQTSDSIIQIIHQTFTAHTTFLYLYSEEDKELMLQSFRTESTFFSATTRNLLSQRGTKLFSAVLESRENKLFPSLAPDERDLFYYSRMQDVHTLLLVPLLRRGTLLGVVGVDHLKAERYSDHHVTLLEQYGQLLIQTIQNIDGVYVKNKLRRMFQTLKEFNEIVKAEDNDASVFKYLKESLAHNLKWDVFQIWMRSGSGQELVIADSDGEKALPVETSSLLESVPEGKALATQKRVYLPDVQFAETKKTCLAVPFVDHGHCFGVLHLESFQPDAWDMYEVQFIENMCHSVSLALARAQLDKHLFSEMPHDTLTGLDNLQTFNRKIAAEIHRGKRFGTTFSLLIFYVDYIKNIYENFGVAAGDFATEKIAEIIRNSKRQIDSAARIGNDKFGLIVLESKRDEARECAQRVLRNIEVSEIDFNGSAIPLSAVIGIATFGIDGENPEQLIHSAEKAVQIARKMKEMKIGFVS